MGETILDCAGITRAFDGRGDSAQNDDLPYAETGYPENTSGPKGWTIRGLTIANASGAGVGDELSLPPLDCVIADNTVCNTLSSHGLMEYQDDPNNLTYLRNIMYGADLGIDLPASGILWQDPGLIPTDTVWRPSRDSSLLEAAQSRFDVVTTDIDGQTRSGLFDVGADEYSDEPITNRPLAPDDVGPVGTPPRRRLRR